MEGSTLFLVVGKPETFRAMTEVGAYRPHINREEWLLAMWETFLLSRHNAFVLQDAAFIEM